MAETKVRFDGLDSGAISDETASKAGTASNKLMTPEQTKTAIQHFMNTLNETSAALKNKTTNPFKLSDSTPTTHITVNTVPFAFDDNTNLTPPSEFSKSLSATWVVGTNQGGLDTGTKAPSTLYYVWIISNGTVVDALYSLSATAPTMPGGYTKKVRVGSVLTNSSSNMVGYMTIHDATGYSATNAATFLMEYNASNVLQNFIIKYGNTWSDGTNRFTFANDGDFVASGDITAFSDERLKENIRPLENALDMICKLQGVRYNKKLQNRERIGLVAQQVEKILPELVKDNGGEDNLKSVAYDKLVAVLIEAIKDLSQRVEELESQTKGD